MQHSKSLVGQYRLNALTLNPDLVARVDEEIAFELDMTPDATLSQHWIFQDTMYSAALADLVAAVRKVQQEAGMPGVLSDMQLAAKLLRRSDFWHVPKPTTVWEKTKFMSRFLSAYSQIFVKARQALNYEKLKTRQHAPRQMPT